MPVSDADRYAFKYVNGHPGNPDRGVSTVMAFGALADTDTGYPVLLSELTLTTAFRTAAATSNCVRGAGSSGFPRTRHDRLRRAE